jgi:stage IV sporulation protein FB
MWVIELGSIAKIPIRVHITFLILVLWLSLGASDTSPMLEALFVVLVFLCVLLHELGHALVAQRFGVQTRDITLYPIGGIATLKQQPGPAAELVIALAGPLVNLAISGALLLCFSDLAPSPSLVFPSAEAIRKPSMVDRLYQTNIMLAVFNLLPALPMDGGRVLRAVLSVLRFKNPTAIAARISQGLCILMAVMAFAAKQPLLFFIAFLIFFAALQEHVRAESSAAAVAFTAKDAMIPRGKLESIAHGTTVSSALKAALTSLQPLYPVVIGPDLVGVVQREEILRHAATQPDAYVTELASRSLPTIDAAHPLSEAFTLLESSGSPAVVVQEEGNFIGLLVPDRVAEFILLTSIQKQSSKDDDTEWSVPL